MELYLNKNWTERYGNAYIAEAIAWSENGDHPTTYTMVPSPKRRTASLSRRCANSS